MPDVATMQPEITPRKLSRNVALGFNKMEHFRKNRLMFMQQYVGRFYSKRIGLPWATDDKKAAPLGMVFNAVQTLVPNLVFSDPRCKVRSQRIEYREYASVLGLASDHLGRQIKLRETLRRVITDSIFLAGWIKCGLGVSGQTLDIMDQPHDIGQPYADRVDPDDMVIDPLARTLEEVVWIGNRFRLPLNAALESGMYDPDVLMRYQSRYQTPEPDFAANLSNPNRGFAGEVNELLRYIDLVEVYIPKDNIIVTMPYDRYGATSDQFLRVVDFEGPDTGPYHMLGYAFVPDNIMPVAPAMVWYDLHIMANRMARKVVRQVERSKRVLAYEAQAAEDAADIVDADDGESVRVDHVDAIKEIMFGGTKDDNYEFIDWSKKNFAEMAMNLDLLSGAASNQATASQAEMLQANTSVRLADMQHIVYHLTADVMKHLAYYLHTDPLIQLPLIRRVGSAEEQVVYTPEMRRGEFWDYEFAVEPYSMARQDPNMRVRRILEFTGSVIPALAQAFQLLGPAFNIDATLALIGREMGIEELDEIINSPIIKMQVERLKAFMEAKVPLDPKLLQFMAQQANVAQSLPMMGAMGMGGQMGMGQSPPPLPGGGRPQQPNPGGRVPAGVTPGTEQAQQHQATAGEMQSSRASRHASISSMAQTKG